MKPDWGVIVSFKTELLSEYLIHQGYREYLPSLLPELGLLRHRMIIDNDIYVDFNEVNAVRRVLSQDVIGLASKAYKGIEKQSKNFIRISQQLAAGAVARLSQDDLSSRLQIFFEEYKKTLGAIGIPTIIDLVLEDNIQEALTTSRVTNGAHALQLLAISQKKLGIATEHNALLSLAIEFQKNGLNSLESTSLLNVKEMYPSLYDRIRTHAKTFGWVYSTLFLGDVYDEQQIFEELGIALQDPAREVARIAKQRAKQQQEARRVIGAIPSLQNRVVATFLQTAVYFRTARLEWLNQACFIFRPVLEEVATRLRMDFIDIIYCLPHEIIDALNGKRSLNRLTITERRAGYALVTDDDQPCALFVGRELQRLHNTFSPSPSTGEVKGIVACAGKSTGRVVVVRDRSDLHKVKQGDILVSPLTTPDFIVAMKKAGAIVTDLGGITSHAAIVSRELHIPCIVGTQNATQMLKDGDRIEVDADKGIVRKV